MESSYVLDSRLCGNAPLRRLWLRLSSLSHKGRGGLVDLAHWTVFPGTGPYQLKGLGIRSNPTDGRHWTRSIQPNEKGTF